MTVWAAIDILCYFGSEEGISIFTSSVREELIFSVECVCLFAPIMDHHVSDEFEGQGHQGQKCKNSSFQPSIRKMWSKVQVTRANFKVVCRGGEFSTVRPRSGNATHGRFHSYLSTDYFGTRLIIFDNNMNTIGNHFLYQVRGQISCIYDPLCPLKVEFQGIPRMSR